MTIDHDVVRNLSRDQRQEMLVNWAEQAFGRDQATSIPQRGLRLLEEAIEAFQASGGDEVMAHKLVTFVFARPPGTVGQELGGVAVTVLLLAAAAGLSADEEECREIHRVLSKPLREFTERNANKNAAGFTIESKSRCPWDGCPTPEACDSARNRNGCCAKHHRNSCCGNVGTHGEGGHEYCSACGKEIL